MTISKTDSVKLHHFHKAQSESKVSGPKSQAPRKQGHAVSFHGSEPKKQLHKMDEFIEASPKRVKHAMQELKSQLKDERARTQKDLKELKALVQGERSERPSHKGSKNEPRFERPYFKRTKDPKHTLNAPTTKDPKLTLEEPKSSGDTKRKAHLETKR